MGLRFVVGCPGHPAQIYAEGFRVSQDRRSARRRLSGPSLSSSRSVGRFPTMRSLRREVQQSCTSPRPRGDTEVLRGFVGFPAEADLRGQTPAILIYSDATLS